MFTWQDKGDWASDANMKHLEFSLQQVMEIARGMAGGGIANIGVWFSFNIDLTYCHEVTTVVIHDSREHKQTLTQRKQSCNKTKN